MGRGFQVNAFQNNAFQMGGGSGAAPAVIPRRFRQKVITEEENVQEFVITIQRLVHRETDFSIPVLKRVFRLESLTLPIIREIFSDENLGIAIIRDVRRASSYVVSGSVLKDNAPSRALVKTFRELNEMKDRLANMNKNQQNLVRIAKIQLISELHEEIREASFEQPRILQEFLTTGDERVCPICSPLHAQAWPISKYPGTYIPPLHSRCRCYVNAFISPITDLELEASRPPKVQTKQPFALPP